jgi:hypothetical protein
MDGFDGCSKQVVIKSITTAKGGGLKVHPP